MSKNIFDCLSDADIDIAGRLSEMCPIVDIKAKNRIASEVERKLRACDDEGYEVTVSGVELYHRKRWRGVPIAASFVLAAGAVLAGIKLLADYAPAAEQSGISSFVASTEIDGSTQDTAASNSLAVPKIQPSGYEVRMNKLEDSITVNGTTLPAGTIAAAVDCEVYFYYRRNNTGVIKFGEAYEIIRTSESEPLITFDSERTEHRLQTVIENGSLKFTITPDKDIPDISGKFTVYLKVDEELEKDMMFSWIGD